MKIFLSWSGPHSRAIAEALNDWLRRVIQAVKPFYSPEIEKGAKWSGEIDNALEGTSFGIICLTRESLNSTWIHFEAGALSKTKDAQIWTFLHGLTPGDVPPPLGKFQHTMAEKADTLELLKTINRRLGEVGGESLAERLLDENFETFWPQLESKLKAAEKLVELPSPVKSASVLETQRGSREILDEILDLARNQERRLNEMEQSLSTFPRPLLSARRENRLVFSGVFIRIPLNPESEGNESILDLAIADLERAILKTNTYIAIDVLEKEKTHCRIRAIFEPPIAKDVLAKIIAKSCPSGTEWHSA